jgi:hypothetical protein
MFPRLILIMIWIKIFQSLSKVQNNYNYLVVQRLSSNLKDNFKKKKRIHGTQIVFFQLYHTVLILRTFHSAKKKLRSLMTSAYLISIMIWKLSNAICSLTFYMTIIFSTLMNSKLIYLILMITFGKLF